MKSLHNSKSFIIICMTAIQTLNKSVCLADEICYENFLGQANLSYLCPTYCCGEATTYPHPFLYCCDVCSHSYYRNEKLVTCYPDIVTHHSTMRILFMLSFSLVQACLVKATLTNLMQIVSRNNDMTAVAGRQDSPN
ncbi:hypothetical protein BOX15_Mlig004614g3 [Macrostomum lignano]|uniref:Uncharacterized protein n=1 Tax=Macrostomum lignano TaxID=282301 RepID=A0A267DCA4_9PLAT|nr:hypothetical protein BOX15_Mlig004614g3 [Macrostomum lignano]